METWPKYAFLSLLTLTVGGLVAIAIYQPKREALAGPPIKGSGSSFVYPAMVQWGSEFEQRESGCRVGYRSVGSGMGIQNFIDSKVDFCCSDAPLTPEQIAKAQQHGGEVLHIPLVLGAVVPVYNLPGLKDPLRFSGPVLADIYLGEIKRWNDKPLRDLNPGVKLPNDEIKVIHRSDSSGTTYIWTDFLAKSIASRKQTPDPAAELKWPGTDVKWKTPNGANGNHGVAQKVRTTPGSIGYVELTYAYQLDLTMGLVQNSKGEFIKASLVSIAKAAENALVNIPEDLRFSLTDAPGHGSYPVAGTTWAIVRNKQPAKGQFLVDFLNYVTGEGQIGVEMLFYGRLPESLRERSRKNIDKIN